MKKTLIAALSIALIIVVSLVAYIALTWQPPNNPPANPDEPVNYTYTIINTYPHDTTAFTEGLVYQDGFLYESTGLNGNSTIQRENIAVGREFQEASLPSQYFGEGITIFGDKIIWLTWQSQIGFIYDKNTFQPLGNFTYPTEGWGITNNGTTLIMSDGTATLYFLNPQNYTRTGTIEVHDNTGPIVMLNELEYINGDVYANIWQQNRIAIINIQTGQVKGWINLTGLHQNNGDPEAVLNGIAYDAANNRLFVTGKRWPQLFEITLSPT